MKLSRTDCQLGDIVEYYVDSTGHPSSAPGRVETATIISLGNQSLGANAGSILVIGWKTKPPFAITMITKSISNWDGYDKISSLDEYTAYYAGFFSTFEVIHHYHSNTTPQARQEKPCASCHAPNDVGVKTCWKCGALDPTRSGAVSPEAIRRGYI